jgi:hypothetical protein
MATSQFLTWKHHVSRFLVTGLNLLSALFVLIIFLNSDYLAPGERLLYVVLAITLAVNLFYLWVAEFSSVRRLERTVHMARLQRELSDLSSEKMS